jgi:hypothetical protein
MKYLLFLFYVVIAIWVIYICFCHKSSTDGAYYKIRRTPLFYFFGAPYRIVRSEIEGSLTYISVRIDRGIVISFLVYPDGDGWYCIDCQIEKWFIMYDLDIRSFSKKGQFRSPDDISSNFKIDEIRNYQDFGMTDQDFEKIKKSLVVAAKHVEEKKKQKEVIKIFS